MRITLNIVGSLFLLAGRFGSCKGSMCFLQFHDRTDSVDGLWRYRVCSGHRLLLLLTGREKRVEDNNSKLPTAIFASARTPEGIFPTCL